MASLEPNVDTIVQMFDDGMACMHAIFANLPQISVEKCSTMSVHPQVLSSPQHEKERTSGWQPASVNILLFIC